jgi:hypothetical protein
LCSKSSHKKTAGASVWGASLFEGLIVSEAFKVFALRGKRPDLYFWRSYHGLEATSSCASLRSCPRGDKAHRHAGLEARRGAPQVPGAWLEGRRRRAGCNVRERVEFPGGNVSLPWGEFPEWLGREVGGPVA